MSVVIETTLGDITVDLYLNQRPVTCLNFLKLCKMKYYNFCLFHSIRSGFIAQTGDPSGEGTGGQSIFGLLEGPEKRFFSGEKMPKIRHTDAGLLSMVCSNDMMVGSQFFFTLASDLDSLDGVHCVIGEVTEGQEVLRQLNEVICDETHRPYRDVRITHTVVLDDPYADPLGLRAPSRSPSPSAERLKGGRIAPDEELDETKGKSAAEIQELIEEREAKARATILEIVGDLPDADIAPPENVLFVCKLNPVTTDEDLEIIFSRFGKIVSCEVIRDKKTNDSLQYAFIEFDDKKSCEEAYFKMDNVLIDDRRIHVDFSQSVSKIKWLGKGRGVKHINEDDNDKGKWSKNDIGLDKEVDRNRRDRPREKDRLHNRIEEYRSKREDSRHMRERSRSRTRLQKNRDDPKRDNRQRQTSRSRSRDRQSRREQRRSRSRERLSNNNYEREHSRKDRKDYKELNSDQSHEINRDRKDSFVEETSKRHKLDDKDNYKFNKNNHRERSASRSRAEVDNSRQSRRQKSASPDRNDVSLEMNKEKKYRKIHNGNGDSDRIIAKSSNKEDKDSNIKNYKVSKTDKSIKRHASIDRNGDNDSSSKRNRKDKSEKVDSTKNKQAKLSKGKKNKTPSIVNKKEKVKTKKKVKKQRKDSTSTDSSSESSSSSSDSSSSGIDKRKKTLKRKKKKYETSSSSSSSSSSSDTTSSSSSSSDSSTNSSSSDSIRKSKKKNKKVVLKKNKKTSKKK